jgi:hypothetical protein
MITLSGKKPYHIHPDPQVLACFVGLVIWSAKGSSLLLRDEDIFNPGSVQF